LDTSCLYPKEQAADDRLPLQSRCPKLPPVEFRLSPRSHACYRLF
jgi:hypothetical protein